METKSSIARGCKFNAMAALVPLNHVYVSGDRCIVGNEMSVELARNRSTSLFMGREPVH